MKFWIFIKYTPTYRFWSIDFHITVAQILAIILAIVLKKNFKWRTERATAILCQGKQMIIHLTQERTGM